MGPLQLLAAGTLAAVSLAESASPSCFAPWRGSRADYGTAAYARDALDSAVAVVRVRLAGPRPGSFTPDPTEFPAPAAAQLQITTLRFVVLERLKGTVPDTLHITGRLVDAHRVNDGPFPYPLPRHRGGDCYSREYRVGGEYLLLLGRRARATTLTPYWAPMTLSAEAVVPNDSWLAFARRHLGSGRSSSR